LMAAAAVMVSVGVLTAITPAHARIERVSDQLLVLDGSGHFIDRPIEFEPGENAGQIFTTSVAIDPSQFGNATVLTDGLNGPASDIFGICTCGPGGTLALGFASDSETQSVNFGVFPRTFVEAGPISATLYLAPALQAQGWTATFTSDVADGVPELSTWAMMILGFGSVGLRLRRRSAVAATA
jgi:hypothetical protein